MTSVDRTRPQRLFWSVLVAYAVTWTGIAWLSSPSLDPYGDMVENYAWSQTWSWGTFKHPPLVGWIVGAWFAIFPTRVWAYYILSYLNAAVGVLGIVALAGIWLPASVSPARRSVVAMLVLLFAILSFPYSNLAAKFNTDMVLLSTWPWTAYAFFASVRADDARRKWMFTILLAVTSTAAMLGKYYSALLLAALVVVSFSHMDYRRWLRTPHPYVALLMSAALLFPHLRWEIEKGFPFRDYLETKIDSGIDPARIAVFLLSAIYYLPLSWLAWLALRRTSAARQRSPVQWALPLRGLVLVAVLPAVFTALFNVFARIHLTSHWAIPVWFALPILMAAWLLPSIDEQFAWNRLSRTIAIVWIFLIAGALVYAVVLARTGNPKYTLARREMVDTIQRRFADRFRGQQLSWAAGAWPESGAVAFFAPSHPRALPGLPDGRRALVVPYSEWRHTNGVILCYASGDYARAGARDVDCEREAVSWLGSHNLPVAKDTLDYRAEGWRFPVAQEKNVTVFWVPALMDRE